MARPQQARFKAFSWHLACSAVVGLIFYGLINMLWYPGLWGQALGVNQLFLLVIVVDVVMGPLIMLVIYNPAKKSLVLDMTVVVLLQVAALIYGISVVAQGRPGWVVFNADRFDAVQVSEVDPQALLQAPEVLQQAPWFGPLWISARAPLEVQLRNQILFDSLAGGADLAQRPALWRDLGDASGDIQRKARELEQLQLFNDEQALNQALEQWPEADAWLPLMARQQPMVVLIKRDEPRVVAVVELNPW